jgi:tetratricopeptide (TPR) repeat protein
MGLKKIRVIGVFVFLIWNSNSIFSQTVAEAVGQMEKLNYKKSIETLDKVIKKNPDDASAYAYRGYAYMMTNDFNKALADYKKADSINSNIDTLSGIQWALLASDKYDDSIATGEKILKLDKDNYYAMFRMSEAYKAKQDYPKAIELLDQLLVKYPDNVMAYTYRGYAHMMTEKYDLALADYKKADSIYSTIDTLSGIQWAQLALGKNDESIATGQKILAIDPKNYYAKQRIGDAYLEKKEYAKASENYKQLQEQYGKNADLLWKIGLCEYYKGNKDEATKLFQEGSKLSPEHKGIQYSLSGGSAYPYFAVIPEASAYGFKGSDYVGNGHKYGLGVSYSPNEDWNIRASAVNDVTQNLNSTKGVTNYIIDPINIAYLSDYGYLRFPSSIPRYYTGSYTNLNNLSTLLSSQDYVTTKYALGVSYKLSDSFSMHFSPQVLSSNTSLLNGGAAAQLGVTYTNKFTLSVSGSAISAPNSKGGQGTVTFYYPFLEKFYTSSTMTGQYMSVNSTNIVFITLNPILTTTDTVKNSKGYGFFQQEFGYSSGFFYAGIGGRYGTARTPFMGENWIYTGFDMLYGGYGQIGVKSENFTFQIQYSHDKWLDSRNDRPSSDTVKLMLIWRI